MLRYKVKDGYIIRQIAGTWVAVPTGRRAIETSTIVTLNDSAAFLWNQLASGLNLADLLAKVTEEYEIDEQKAGSEIDKYIEFLKTNNLLDEY